MIVRVVGPAAGRKCALRPRPASTPPNPRRAGVENLRRGHSCNDRRVPAQEGPGGGLGWHLAAPSRNHSGKVAHVSVHRDRQNTEGDSPRPRMRHWQFRVNEQ